MHRFHMIVQCSSGKAAEITNVAEMIFYSLVNRFEMVFQITAIPRLVRSPKSANSISASLGLLVRVPVPFTTYILPRLVRIRLVRMPFFWNALLALTEELLYQVVSSFFGDALSFPTTKTSHYVSHPCNPILYHALHTRAAAQSR